MAFDYSAKITELRAQKGQLLTKAEGLVADGKFDEADGISSQMEDINKNIQSLERLAGISNSNAEPAYDGVLHAEGEGKPKAKGDDCKLFASLGEQLSAIYNAQRYGKVDDRLSKVNNAAGGVNGGTGADGGFLLQTDFVQGIMESAVQNSPLLNRLDRHTCSSPANSMRWVNVAENDVSSSVFGGVQMYWAAEAAAVTASKPQFTEEKLDLEKMMGFAYCTDEMLQDVPFMTSFFGRSFALAADRLLTGSVIAGDGNGKPLGIINSAALITVAAEADQAAGTIVGANAIKMQARTLPTGRNRLVWLAHPDLEEQMPYLSIHSGDAAKFLWNPEGGLGGFDAQRILNKEVIFDDNCSAVGAKGDFMCVDPYQYILLTKGTAKQDWSIHVEFLTDQHCFRMVYRCNGKPKMSHTVTLKNSTLPRSPFVALAARGAAG
ncbi:MAG: phage major capsid protein [Clostridia bacterium]|nr:phage major capsid protein [Clostridia bacterium]